MKRNEKPMKERILEEALQLFSQNGYTGTSMNDIAAKLGVTKAALYKHYKSKQEILDSIVEKASEYGLPEEQQGEDFLSERQVSYDDIKTYTKEQFSYWTSEEFPSCFRRVLTLEQYRELFGCTVHPFTGVDYVAYYMDLIRDCGAAIRGWQISIRDIWQKGRCLIWSRFLSS